MEKLDNILESILFLSGNAVDIKDISEKLNVTPRQLEVSANRLKEKYSGSCGIHILSFNRKLQLSTNPDYAEQVENVLNPIKERELSKAMMEAAAIVAYKQPVTRLDIEEVRGVNSDYAITMLCKHNIIEIVGRKDTLGKPLLYGTTDEFLKRFQISSIEELPDFEELLNRIKIIHPENRDLYYREPYSEKAEQENIQQTAFPEDEELPEFLKDESDIKIIK